MSSTLRIHVCMFIPLFVCLSVRTYIYLFIYSFILLFIYSFIYSSIENDNAIFYNDHIIRLLKDEM